jgi:hypothetical protein
MRHHFRALMGLLIVASLGAACSRPAAAPPTTSAAPPPSTQGALRVTDVDLGVSVGSDKRITNKTESFSPSETIYLSVRTEGAAPSATLKARWTFEDGQVVQESSQTIAPTGTAVTEFHVSNPAGWPKGSYKVEVFLNGSSMETENFKVG